LTERELASQLNEVREKYAVIKVQAVLADPHAGFARPRGAHLADENVEKNASGKIAVLAGRAVCRELARFFDGGRPKDHILRQDARHRGNGFVVRRAFERHDVGDVGGCLPRFDDEYPRRPPLK